MTTVASTCQGLARPGSWQTCQPRNHHGQHDVPRSDLHDAVFPYAQHCSSACQRHISHSKGRASQPRACRCSASRALKVVFLKLGSRHAASLSACWASVASYMSKLGKCVTALCQKLHGILMLKAQRPCARSTRQGKSPLNLSTSLATVALHVTHVLLPFHPAISHVSAGLANRCDPEFLRLWNPSRNTTRTCPAVTGTQHDGRHFHVQLQE